MHSAPNFSTIPILDYELIGSGERSEKAEFIEQLRHALINVGFLYLLNPPVDKVSDIYKQCFASRIQESLDLGVGETCEGARPEDL